MRTTPTADQVLAVISDVTGSAQILANPDTRLYDQHLLDSLRTVQLMVALEEAFGLEIPIAAIDRARWATPRMIAESVIELAAAPR